MNIYLVRHADAKNEGEDPSMPLSEKGLQDIKQVASFLSRLNIKTGNIFHSGKLRARQTAEVLFEYLRPVHGISEADGLSPLDAPLIWKERLGDMKDSVFLVGHLPHLAKLASVLLCAETGKNIVMLGTAGVMCFLRDNAGEWYLQWMMSPDVVGGEAVTGHACDGL
jgi:phosphohistidine phosphatase